MKGGNGGKEEGGVEAWWRQRQSQRQMQRSGGGSSTVDVEPALSVILFVACSALTGKLVFYVGQVESWTTHSPKFSRANSLNKVSYVI